jgi:hypothetical protein
MFDVEATMKKILMLSAAALLLAAPASFAGLDLAWDNCATYTNAPPAAADKALACDGGGTYELYGSIQIGADINNWVAMDAVIDYQTGSDPLPNFWHFGIGQCNDGSILLNLGRLARCSSPAPAASNALCGGTGTSCQQAVGYFSGGIDPSVDSNRGRFVASIFRPSGNPLVLATGATNYFAFRFDIFDFNASEASGPCVGCAQPAAFVWNSALMSGLGLATGIGPEAEEVPVEGPGLSGNCASTNGGTGLCGATPAQDRSWGQIKALYR